MSGWEKFETIGDKERQTGTKPSSGGWLAWVLLVPFLSVVGTLVVVFLARLIPLLVLGSVFGLWFARCDGRQWRRIEIDSKTWKLMFFMLIASALLGWVGHQVVTRFGEWFGGLITFGLVNLVVGTWIAIDQAKQRRAKREQEVERAMRKSSPSETPNRLL